MPSLVLLFRSIAALFHSWSYATRLVSECLFASALCLMLLASPNVAQAGNLFESWPPEVYPVPIESGQIQDFTIPDGFVGKLYVVVRGGDGGRSHIAWSTTNSVAAVGSSGPGASVDAEFAVGSGPDEIPGGSTVRFIIGRQGDSATDLDAGYGDFISSGGGAGSAVYVSLPDSPAICDFKADAPGSACNADLECGQGQCLESGTQFPPSCSSNADCGGATCTPVSKCTTRWKLLIGAGGGGGGFAGLFDYGIAPLPISSDGRYGRHTGDEEGNVNNGGDGGGSFIDSGDGGVFNPTTGGAGGEAGTTNGGSGGGGTASNGENNIYRGGGQANPDYVSPGGDLLNTSGGAGWGGGGFGRLSSGGGGGGLSGGGGGGFHGGGGGGGSYCSSDFTPSYCRMSPRAFTAETRLPLDGTAGYALSPDQATAVYTVNTVVTAGTWKIAAGESWIVQPDVVLTLRPGVVLTIESGGTLVNSGVINNQGKIQNYGGTISAQTGSIIQNVATGEFTNTGPFQNDGAIYNCIRPYVGSAPTGTAPIHGCLLISRVSSSSRGGKEVCESALGGTWSDLDTCRLGTARWSDGLWLDIATGTNLVLEGTLTSFGTINNQGVIDDSAGLLSDCGSYPGLDPTSGATPECILNPDEKYCIDVLMGTSWNDGTHCSIGSYEIEAQETFTVKLGHVLYVTGTLTNRGTLDIYGEIYNQSGITNEPSSVINNYGSLYGDLSNDSSVLFNEGDVINFGTIDIDSNGAVFDNASFGYLTHECGSVYTGAAPINNEHGGVINGCVTPESLLCTGELGGDWDQFTDTCTIIDYNLNSGGSLTIAPGFTLLVTGTLFNQGTIDNEGSLVVRDVIFNSTGGVLNNYGGIFTDLIFDGVATVYNEGSLDNFGSMTIGAGGGVFDNADVGVLTNKCGAGYSGAAPINSPPGSLVDETADGIACEDGDLCTESETCQSGVCTGGTPFVCIASDQCHDAGTCHPASGLCSNPPRVDGCSYLLGGPGASITATSSDLSWDGGAWISGYRAAIEDSLNFGASGLVSRDIDTANLDSVTTETLAPLDGFIVTQWADLDTSPAEVTAVVDFFLAGGDLILLQEDADHDAIGQQLGIPTSPSDGSVSNGGKPLFDGPFGTASDVLQTSITGQISPSDVTSQGGTAAATNSTGEITAAAWGAGDYAPGAGRLLIIADVDMWATTTAAYSPLNSNGIFALNGTATVIPEPTQPWLQLAALGLIARARFASSRASLGRDALGE